MTNVPTDLLRTTGPSFTSLGGAVAAGFGVMAITRRRTQEAGMAIWEDAPLPKLPDRYSGIFIREGARKANTTA